MKAFLVVVFASHTRHEGRIYTVHASDDRAAAAFFCQIPRFLLAPIATTVLSPHWHRIFNYREGVEYYDAANLNAKVQVWPMWGWEGPQTTGADSIGVGRAAGYGSALFNQDHVPMKVYVPPTFQGPEPAFKPPLKQSDFIGGVHIPGITE